MLFVNELGPMFVFVFFKYVEENKLKYKKKLNLWTNRAGCHASVLFWYQLKCVPEHTEVALKAGHTILVLLMFESEIYWFK